MKNLKYLLLLLSTFAVFTCASSSRSSYGETCHKELRCDAKSTLTCLDGICHCLMSDTMVFDENEKKCVTLAGERCVYTATEGNRSWSEHLPCISNSKCLNGVCACDLEYFELGNGSCAGRSSFGGPCSQNSSTCQQHLRCGESDTCECEENRIYDESRKACVHLAGRNCGTGNDNKCVSNAKCEGGKCTCLKTHFQRENGTCEKKRDFGGECKSKDTCDTEKLLDCQQGFCKCVPGRSYDASRSFCLLNSGMKCLDGRNADCVKNANCQYQGFGSWTYKCTCWAGYRQYTDMCQPKQRYRESCDANLVCNEDLNFVCNLGTGKCECQTGTLYHPGKQMCVGKVGSSCTRGDTCVPNAGCQYHKCVCNYMLTHTSIRNDGYCYIEENGNCNTNVASFEDIVSANTQVCLPGLVCSNYICSCHHKYHQVYSKSLEKCFSLVGGPCNDTVECVRNAECVNEDGLNVCRCKSRFLPINRKCESLAYGEKCSQSDHSLKCDRLVPLICSERGRCECRELQVYDENRKICRGLVGAECDAKRCQYSEGMAGCCVDGGTCNAFRSDDGTRGSCICKPSYEQQKNRTCISRSTVVVFNEEDDRENKID